MSAEIKPRHRERAKSLLRRPCELYWYEGELQYWKCDIHGANGTDSRYGDTREGTGVCSQAGREMDILARAIADTEARMVGYLAGRLNGSDPDEGHSDLADAIVAITTGEYLKEPMS